MMGKDVPQGLKRNGVLTQAPKLVPFRPTTPSAAGLMRPNVATAGVPQHQLILQLDMLRLGFVAQLASMAIDELVEEQFGGNSSYIFAGLAYDADRWAKRRGKFEIIKANECHLPGYVDMQLLKYFIRIDGDEILKSEDCVRGIRGIEVALDRRLCRFVILNRGIDDGIESVLLDSFFIASNTFFDGIEIDFSAQA